VRQKIIQFLTGIIILSVVALIFYFIISAIGRFLVALDQPLIVAILAACATVLTATITVVVGRIFERKKETESHFRQRKYDQYDELLKILYGFFGQDSQVSDSDEVGKKLMEWQRKLILFASPKTIRAYVEWMSNLKAGELRLRTIILMEAFFKSLRSDLGISNIGLKEGDFAHLILRHADLFVAMAKQNPNMTLAELGQLEKTLGLDAPSSSPPSSKST